MQSGSLVRSVFILFLLLILPTTGFALRDAPAAWWRAFCEPSAIPIPEPIIQTLTISGRANIVSAGRSRARVTGCNPEDPGDPPPFITIPSNITLIRVVEVTGRIEFCAGRDDCLTGPDGFVKQENRFDAVNSISGMVTERLNFLTGVFTGEFAPSGDAPPSLNIAGREGRISRQSGLLLHQLFLLGDGRADNRAEVEVEVPTGATRLYLGVVDACFTTRSSNGRNQFGGYHDNGGSWRATLELIPGS